MLARPAIASLVAAAAWVGAGVPEYTITDLGVADPGDFASQGFGISPGGVAHGRSVGTRSVAFISTPGGGFVPLPNDPSRAYGVANGANDSGLVVGVGSTTLSGAGAIPLQWSSGVVSQLAIEPGLGVGRANDVNSSGIVVGSNGGGSQEVATWWNGSGVHTITTTTGGGASMTTAFRVNDDGLAVGVGIDPGALARQVPLLYDVHTDTLTEIPSLAGDNGGIAFDVSQNGFVVGSSSFNQSGSVPFLWSTLGGTVEVPLPAGAGSGSARGVNSDGWVVGTASSAFALPFLYDGDTTYLLQDLIPAGSGWDLSMNTSSSALGISEDGSIVGTALFNGEIRAYRMTLVPAPWTIAMIGLVMFGRRRG